ncbi:Nop52-domain-containing protein [Cystobasidium minutum MCA 4210]|uniref:Nop52-domain-containing protein n=1 Tax=Cystobasidium minutum MCA 4210 TaxID=1397322 RepID=UPI0034CE948B|eukprot:jgi/Rhomi1/208048/estExt_Genemark1.C_1_t30050
MASMAAVPLASTSARPIKTRKAKTSKPSSNAVDKKTRKPPLGKLLASSDKETREDAVEHLLVYLSGKGDLAETEKQDLDNDGQGVAMEQQDASTSLKDVKLPKAFQEEQLNVLWQGCFYCMYMCDKPLPQQKLASQLAEPIVTILENPRLKSKTARRKASLAYLSTFWKTMVRELPGIDRHRMDKYYSLMRRVLHNTFIMLRKTGWNEDVMAEANSYLFRQGGPLHLQDIKTPISVAYHILDIYITELERSVSDLSEEEEDALSSQPVPLLKLVEPLIQELAIVVNKDHYKRIVDNIFEPLMDMLDEAKGEEPSSKRRRLETEDGDDHEEGEQTLLRGQPASLKLDILRKMFSTGAKEDTDPVNRKRLYKFAADHGLDE